MKNLRRFAHGLLGEGFDAKWFRSLAKKLAKGNRQSHAKQLHSWGIIEPVGRVEKGSDRKIWGPGKHYEEFLEAMG